MERRRRLHAHVSATFASTKWRMASAPNWCCLALGLAKTCYVSGIRHISEWGPRNVDRTYAKSQCVCTFDMSDLHELVVAVTWCNYSKRLRKCNTMVIHGSLNTLQASACVPGFSWASISTSDAGASSIESNCEREGPRAKQKDQ